MKVTAPSWRNGNRTFRSGSQKRLLPLPGPFPPEIDPPDRFLPLRVTGYKAFTISSAIFLASARSIMVLSLKKSSFCTPA